MSFMEKIMLVEDNKILGKAFSMSLMNEGFTVILVDNGEEALSMALSEKPDLIILDVVMPGMGGFEVCQKLKEYDETKDIYIIFLSNLRQADQIEKAKDLGVLEYLSKRQFTPIKLSEKVKDILSGLKQKEMYKEESLSKYTKELPSYVIESEGIVTDEIITIFKGDKHYVFTADEISTVRTASEKHKALEKLYLEIEEKYKNAIEKLKKVRKKASNLDKLIQIKREQLIEAELFLKDQESKLGELNNKLTSVKWYDIAEKRQTQTAAKQLKEEIINFKTRVSKLRQEINESQSKAAQAAHSVARKESDLSSIEDEFKEAEKKHINSQKELSEIIFKIGEVARERKPSGEVSSPEKLQEQKVHEIVSLIEEKKSSAIEPESGEEVSGEYLEIIGEEVNEDVEITGGEEDEVIQGEETVEIVEREEDVGVMEGEEGEEYVEIIEGEEDEEEYVEIIEEEEGEEVIDLDYMESEKVDKEKIEKGVEEDELVLSFADEDINKIREVANSLIEVKKRRKKSLNLVELLSEELIELRKRQEETLKVI